MFKSALLLGLLLFSVNLFAQDKTRQEVIQLMSDDTCDCIKSDPESFSHDKSLNQKQVALGLCLFKSYNIRKESSEAIKDSGINGFEALGEEVGVQMVSTCGAEFMAIFSDEQLDEIIDDVVDQENQVIPPPPAPKNEEDLLLEAELTALNNDAISYFQVKDGFDKTHTFLINEQFEGFELLKKSNFNKPFNIYYKEVEMFDLSERKYVKKKVVKYLEVIE